MIWSFLAFVFFAQVNCLSECPNTEKVKLEQLLTQPDLMLKYQENHGQQILFIETSGRDHLSTRQACAVESAARSRGKNLCSNFYFAK